MYGIFINHLVISILMLLSFFVSKQSDPRDILSKAGEALKKHKSISYDASYRMKFFNDDDTLSASARCEIIREPHDTLIGGYVWVYFQKDSIEKMYDLKNIFEISHTKKSIEIFDALKDGVTFLTGNYSDAVIFDEFFKSSRLINALNKKNIISFLGEEKILDYMCWRIQVKYPDREEYSEIERNFYIEKKGFVPIRTTYKVKFQENYQYNELTLSKITFDKVSKKRFSVQILPKKYIVMNYVPQSEDNEKPLANGTKAPLFTGNIFGSEQQSKLSEYEGKFILLDFWKMACYPCIKSIPHLEELHNKYREKGLIVIGVNSVDIDEKSKRRLPQFLKINKVTYPIWLTEKKTESLYNISGYPTLYLIDKKGEIIFSQLGFIEGVDDSLTKVIAQHIK